MEKINWKRNNLSLSTDGTGFIEEYINKKIYLLEFTWRIKYWDDLTERIIVHIDFEDIYTYDDDTQTDVALSPKEYEEDLIDMIEDYINENSDDFGIRNLEDLDDLLNNYE